MIRPGGYVVSSSPGYRLAIDFGTSNTVAAISWNGGEARPLRLGSQGDATPSAVMVWKFMLRTGDEALRLAALDFAAFERTPKRRMGQEVVALGRSTVRPTDMIAAIFRMTREHALRQADNTEPRSVVITHPQEWGSERVTLLKHAAVLAGFRAETLSTVSEPVAAAFAHRHTAAWGEGDLVAVVDFGGGTFDAALVEVRSVNRGRPDFTVIGATGRDPLGGDDFDTMLEDWVLEQLVADGHHELVEALHDPENLHHQLTLRDEVRRAKEALSSNSSTPILVTAGNHRVRVTATQREFEELIRPHVQVAIDRTLAMLAGPDGAPRTVKQLFLTGGSSLIPLVQREFQALTTSRVGSLGDPKAVTALGALSAPTSSGSRPVRSSDQITGPVSVVDTHDHEPGVERSTTEPQPSPQREPTTRAGSRSKKRLVSVSVGVALLAAVVASAFALDQRSSGALHTSGVVSLGNGVVTGSGQKKAADPPPVVCPTALSADECSVVTEVAALVEVSSCAREPQTPDWVGCNLAAGRPVPGASRSRMYVSRYAPAVADPEAETQKLADSRTGVTDPDWSTDPKAQPGREDWTDAGGQVAGRTWNLRDQDGDTHFVWLVNQTRLIAWLTAPGADGATAYNWWYENWTRTPDPASTPDSSGAATS